MQIQVNTPSHVFANFTESYFCDFNFSSMDDCPSLTKVSILQGKNLLLMQQILSLKS